MHALGHPFKARDHGARPRSLRHVRKHALEKGSSILNALKSLPLQPLLHLREQNEITKGRTRGIRGLGDLLNAICFQVVQSGGGGLDTCIVAVKKQAADAVVWMAYTPGLEDFGKLVS